MRLLVKNFGPIANDAGEYIHITPVTVLCGNQGSGKSTAAKLASVFLWMEKALVRGDFKESELTRYDRFRKRYCAFHGIQNYFKENSEISFEGDYYVFSYSKKHLAIKRKDTLTEYSRPQIMYVPAERNFMSAVEYAEKIKRLPSALSAMIEEYFNALKNATGKVPLPIEGFSVQYDKLNNVSWLVGGDFKVRVTEAASGFQSIIPLVLVSKYLSSKIINDKEEENERKEESVEERAALDSKIIKILSKNHLDEKVRESLLRQLNRSVRNKRFINIVEEPEQNLFPSSQRNVLYELLKINSSAKGNHLLFTTHSPYLINYLTLSIKAGEIKKDYSDKQEVKKVDEIIPQGCSLLSRDVSIYELSDTGTITTLKKYETIPSDNNYLNNSIEDTNNLFDKLLDIEELCQK